MPLTLGQACLGDENSCFEARQVLPTHRLTWIAGLRQATSTFGALVGATVAGLAFKLSGSNYVLTFALSAVPAFLALLLVTAVRSVTAQTVSTPRQQGLGPLRCPR